jgi:toxin-antitoxin system PIN domain toxin
MLVDANILLAAIDRNNPRHPAATMWMVEHLNGARRVGLPWPSLLAFLRIATNPRAFPKPLDPITAWDRVRDWLDAPAAWVPVPGPRHAELLESLITNHQPAANLIPDAHLAALALEHGLTVISADTDFGRFTEVRWVDPLA